MRLGGPIFDPASDPEAWVAAHKALGYGAAYSPVDSKASENTIEAYKHAAEKAGIVIAEVGAWSNPLSDDPKIRKEAMDHCKAQLNLADRLKARCCVNIAGSRGAQWDGPHPDNFSQDTFDKIVEIVREIIDTVKPVHTFYTLEPMPWIFPDNPEDYLRLIKAIDRKAFGAHVDPVNVINSPRRCYENTQLLKDWFQVLGPHIRSCHAKDILLSGKLTVHLDEVRPGMGTMDYRTYLKEIQKLEPDMTLMIEHLHTKEDYQEGISYIRDTAQSIGIEFVT